MSAQRPLRSYDFSYEGSKEVEMPEAQASGEIKGTRISFKTSEDLKPREGFEKTFEFPFLDDSERKNTEWLLNTLLTDLKFINPVNGKILKGPTRYRLQMSDLYDSKKSFMSLKALMFNFLKLRPFSDKTIFLNNYFEEVANKKPSNLGKQLQLILSRYLDYIRELGFDQIKSFTTDESEKFLSQEITNITTLKSIYDIIINTEKQLKGTQGSDIYRISAQQPPYYPSLSNEEKIIVWAWVKAKEKALDALHEDKTYQFAMKVAGHVNITEFGIDKLITSAHQQRPNMQKYDNMPPSFVDESRMAQEREQLFSRMIELKQAIEFSKYEDIKREQKRLNDQVPDDAQFELRDEDENKKYVELFRTRYGADDEEIPDPFAELADMDTMPLSETTRMLMFNFETVERALKGMTLEHSRKRMLLATDWMQQPEVLQHGDLSPLFVSALSGALMRLRHRCPNLSHVTEYDQLIESPDSDVVDAFSELVAMQIMRIRFFSPTRVNLDKMGERITSRENHLIYMMAKFTFDGKFVRSNIGPSYNQFSNSALYAF